MSVRIVLSNRTSELSNILTIGLHLVSLIIEYGLIQIQRPLERDTFSKQHLFKS